MDIQKIFTQLSRKIKKLSPDEISLLENGHFEIVFTKAKNKTPKTVVQACVASITKVLENAKDRQEVYAILEEQNPTVADLTLIARNIGVHVNKKEKKDDLINKLIANTVDLKLNSEAVRGKKKSSTQIPLVED